jgi:UDP-N-acetylglucosamine:LPS N-acetylglucosamine transferase
VRVLILSAPVGESHAAMAAELARQLEREPAVESVRVLNDFAVLGPALQALLPRGFEVHLGRIQWTYDLAYRLFTRVGAARRFGELALYALGARTLLGTIEREHPDVVVSTYPVINPVLARLRAHGRLRCPVGLVVGPLGGLGFWIQPGVDLHLTQYDEVRACVERIAGPGRAATIRPLVREEFLLPGSCAQARAELEIPAERRVVLVSGGGWGAGDLGGAIDACLALPDADVIAVCGRNRERLDALSARYGDRKRVRLLAFTERMRDLMWAADAFVTATAGLSCIEARLCGCPTVTFGFQIGHVRDNTRALERAGYVRVAHSPDELRSALAAALAADRPPPPALNGLPSPAQAVLALAGAAAGRDAPESARVG